MHSDTNGNPAWFELGYELIWPTLRLACEKLREVENASVRVPTECAAIHLLHVLDTSVEANKEGKHSVAVALLRQCTEAITVLELGLIDRSIGEKLLSHWMSGAKSQGNIRQKLEANLWTSYGNGLWGESWSDYFGNLARAVNPYAHYTPELQGWQMVVPDGMPLFETDSGMLKSYMTYGPKSYDANKATRITLLHMLVAWTVGRLISENGGDSRLSREDIASLGDALAKSEILGGGQLDWPKQFWANEFWGANSDT